MGLTLSSTLIRSLGVNLALCLLALVAVFPAHASERLNILDYYQLLPKTYRHFYADIASAPQVEADIPRGYLAVTAPELDEPLFEMALFRAEDGGARLITSALQRDPVCSHYESFQLRYQDGKWHEMDLLPNLDPKWFYVEGVWPKRLPKQRIRLYPPRIGRVLTIEPNVICDEALGISNYWKGPRAELRWSPQKAIFIKMKGAPRWP